MIAQLVSGYYEYYTPPPFKVCHRCDDGVKIVQGVRYTCGTCNGTGRIPIYYTIPQWEKLTGRNVPLDLPVWLYFGGHWTSGYTIGSIGVTELTVMITEAGRLPKDWRPE